MNREEFIARYHEFCAKIGEQPQNVLVSAGGALLMLGLRDETSDLDLDVDVEVYNRYLGTDNVRRSSLGEYVDYDDVISLHAMFVPLEKMEIDGVYLYSVSEMIHQKCRLADMPDRLPGKRDKDLLDLAALKSLL